MGNFYAEIISERSVVAFKIDELMVDTFQYGYNLFKVLFDV